MQCNKVSEKPVKLWASFNFELIVVWFWLSLFRLWLRNIKHGRLSLRENHEHTKYRVKRCFFNQSWSSKLFAVDDCCQRKLSGKEINRNFGGDSDFGVFERRAGACEFSSVRMRYLLKRSAHLNLNNMQNIESPSRRLRHRLCLPSERKTWILITLLKEWRAGTGLVKS